MKANRVHVVLAMVLLSACTKKHRGGVAHQPTEVVVALPSQSTPVAGVHVSCTLKIDGTRPIPVKLKIENASPSTIVFAPQEQHLPRTRVLEDGSVVVLYGMYDAHHPTDRAADIVLAPGEARDVRSSIHVARKADGVRATGEGSDLQLPHVWRCGLHYRLKGGTTALLATSKGMTLAIDSVSLDGDEVF